MKNEWDILSGGKVKQIEGNWELCKIRGYYHHCCPYNYGILLSGSFINWVTWSCQLLRHLLMGQTFLALLLLLTELPIPTVTLIYITLFCFSCNHRLGHPWRQETYLLIGTSLCSSYIIFSKIFRITTLWNQSCFFHCTGEETEA